MTLDEQISVKISTVDEMSAADWKRVEAILRAGGAVNVRSALAEIPIAKHLVLARRDDVIVGLGAIKRAREDYAMETQDKAGQEFDPKICELGYVVVDESLQGEGQSSRILDTLLRAYPDNLFGTTDSEKMRGSLERRGFKQVGKSWRGNRGELSLWIRSVE